MDYWEECVSIALEDAEVTVTKEQLDIIVGGIEGGHENYGMAHGHDCIPNPLAQENSDLRLELKEEREKVHCEPCNGTGRITTYGPSHSSNSQCWKCNGEGGHKP